MQTLFFRVMTPIYMAHSLTPDEQADLMAFLALAETKPVPQWNTQLVLLIALAGGIILVALTGLLWRKRVTSVRGRLVDKATSLHRAERAARAGKTTDAEVRL
jgi:hypothetical protein